MVAKHCYLFIGVAAGVMSVTFLGNSEYRHYVELGPAITAVNAAEHFCHSGMVVISPDTWNYCQQALFDLEAVDDVKHMRVKYMFTIRDNYFRYFFGK